MTAPQAQVNGQLSDAQRQRLERYQDLRLQEKRLQETASKESGAWLRLGHDAFGAKFFALAQRSLVQGATLAPWAILNPVTLWRIAAANLMAATENPPKGWSDTMLKQDNDK